MFRLLGAHYILYIILYIVVCVLQMLHLFKIRQVELTQDDRKTNNNLENIRDTWY